jgi:hypothetical protein
MSPRFAVGSNRFGKIWGEGITPKAIWHVVKANGRDPGFQNLAQYDLRDPTFLTSQTANCSTSSFNGDSRPLTNMDYSDCLW